MGKADEGEGTAQTRKRMLDTAVCHIRGDALAIEVVDIEDLGHLDAYSDVIESFRFG